MADADRTITDDIAYGRNTSLKVAHESGSPMTSGEGTFSRRLATSSVTVATGTLRMAFFRAAKSGSVGKLRAYTAGTAAATVTTIKYGLWEADEAEDDFTLVAATANDATLLAATNTVYEKAVATAYVRTKGKLYAAGILFVGTTAPVVVASPVILGPTGSTSIAYNPTPVSGLIGSLSDLPDTFSLATLVAGAAGLQAPYMDLLPF